MIFQDREYFSLVCPRQAEERPGRDIAARIAQLVGRGIDPIAADFEPARRYPFGERAFQIAIQH